MTSDLALTSRASLLLTSCLALSACGDSVATSASDTETSSTGATETSSSTTEVAPTTSTATTDDSSGTMTATSSTDPTTGTTTTTTGVSATDVTSTTDTSTTDTSTTDTSTTSTSTTSTSTTDTSTSTTDTTDTEGPPDGCLAADFPVIAPLCGDQGPDCATVRDELVSDKPSFRNDMPAIALRGDCEPVVLYSEAVGGYFGFYAERTGPGTWAVESTPMTVATGSLETDPDGGVSFAMVDDGAFGASLWQRENDQWTQLSALAGQNHVRAAQLVRDAQGALHVGHVDSDQVALHEVFDGAWSKEQVLTAADIHVRLALDADAAPRLVTWTSQDATWKLQYVAPPGVSEVVAPLGSNALDRAHSSLALVGPEATPWVLLARKQGDQEHHDVVLAHRTGPDNWALETLAAEDPLADETCSASPTQPGEQCNYDYKRHYPLTLLAGATELRALYLSVRHQGTLVGQCAPMPFPICFWTPLSDESTSELRVAWPGSQPEEHAIAALDVFTDRATGRLDSAGMMHLAFYDRPPGSNDPVVRYLMIGP